MTGETDPLVRLWTPAGFQADPWRHADDTAGLAANAKVILPLDLFLGLDAATSTSARGRVGVLLQPADRLETIVPLLDGLALVALAFPAFNDGRSFSKAELLRSRYGYAGVVRAVGQVLVDQLPHMLRLGFTEFEISNPVLIERLEAGEVGGLPLYYQPTATPAAAGEGYSWRRKPVT